MIFDNCLDAAIAYAQLGWNVFPCKPKTKEPATKHGVKDATTDEAVIRAWWKKWPDANVALACGKSSGVYVVDVDYEEGTSEDGWKDLEEFPTLPATIRQNTPRGGAHFIYKCDENPPRNMNKFRGGIDIRGDGYYIMLSPSVHPNGKVYAWAGSPWDTEAAEFPIFMKPAPKKDRVLPWAKPTSAPRMPSAASEARTRASAYLATVEPAVQGCRGHDKLLWAARAMVEGFGLSQCDAESILWAEYNPRCCPPWNQTDNADRRDFERKVQEVFKSPSGAVIGHLLESSQFQEVNVDAAKRSAEALLASHDDKQVPDVVKRIKSRVAEKAEEVVASDDPGKTPDGMFSVPGFVTDVMEYTLETAPYANKALAFAGALALQSFLCSRKVRDEGDMRPNLYLLALAPSGSGKEWPRKMNKIILSSAGYGSGSVGDRFSSAEGVEDALVRCAAKLYQTDEIDSLLQSLKSKDPLSANLMSGLLTMYGESSSIHYKRDKAGDMDSGFISNPHLIIYGTAIPTHFYATLSDKMCTNGLLSRMIIIDAEADRHGKRAKIIDPPANILDVAKFWKSFNPGGDMASINPIPITLPNSSEANKIMENFQGECDKNWSGATVDNETARAVFSRINEMALKLAIIYACSENHKNPIINENAARWATSFAMHQGKRMLAMLDRYGASSDFEKDCQKIIAYIKGSPNGSITHKLCAGRMKMSKKMFAERIDTLVDRDKIVMVPVATNGRTLRTYEMVKQKK
jgi:hypothetical protein